MPELAHMTWIEIDKLRQETDLAIIPSGAVEVYGRHLPTGSDGIAALALARAGRARACRDRTAGPGGRIQGSQRLSGHALGFGGIAIKKLQGPNCHPDGAERLKGPVRCGELSG